MAGLMSPVSLAGTMLTNALTDAPAVPFGSLWADKPVLIVFMRRLGCPICRQFIREVETLRPAIEAVGGSAVCISFERFGEGSDVDRSFQSGRFFQGTVLTNADKSMYDALFKRKGLFDNFFGLAEIPKAVQEKSKAPNIGGNYIGAMSGFQLGGTFVIAPGGRITLDHRQAFYGDDPIPEVMLSAIANGTPRPGAAADLLEAVVTMPPPRPAEGVSAVCETCITQA